MFSYFPYIKEYFGYKLYTTDDVKCFVKANWITTDEFKTITGMDYVV